MTGITHYTTTTKGIGGRMKRRISDFVVREITPEGNVLHGGAFSESDGKKASPLAVPPKEDESAEYLFLTLEKFNLDTNDAMRRISRHLRCSPKRVSYAGMKDRRGITTQRISLWQPDEKLLATFNEHQRYADLTDPEWRKDKIEIGGLTANEFEVTVRDILLSEDELRAQVRECFAQMEKNGVANYFGEQRFGGAREITHKVGREFVKGNFENAVMMYLTAPSQEEEEIAIARKNLLETRDFARASKEFPSKFRYERSIIHHLCKFPKDFIGAFQNLPRHLRYIFTHAYQSYIFNEIINLRIERGIGLAPIDGDILEDGVPTAALAGFDSTLAQGIPGEIEREAVAREGITLEDFRIRSFAELSCAGARKKIALKPENLNIISVEPDELFEGKLKLKVAFRLTKGNYATTILRELMKSSLSD